MAVESMRLRRGDTVVDVGCGTGLCFPYIQEKVGPGGKIIGVDLSAHMLEEARRRVEKRDWENVELLQCDAAGYEFPKSVGGVISVFALRSIDSFESVVERGARALRPGGRFVILDVKIPEKSPSWLNRLFLLFAKPFGVTMELADRRLWEPAGRYFALTRLVELYFGFAYIFTGEAGGVNSPERERHLT